ncbi:cell division protein FtsQ [Fulvimarina manganoxydans]|uniref:Cell division protein FtsQ n=1 Tax=Fulvimarina manganoxydans TaxID=937218 RepID=A0A1W2AH84_9HYPH|nr:cell division protein FtsQ/DivIB [Fulvimarina manganoxydans]SMC60055.1 cell division protein FtsQ [Fulvimarina manganoxydans]
MRPLNATSGQDRLRPLLAQARRLSGRIGNLHHRLAGWPLPRFRSLAIVVLGGTGLYGMTLGGHTTGFVDALATPFGFSIDKIEVSGNDETSEIDILQTLWGTGSQSLVSLDPTAARNAIEAMPWVERAAITKYYPDRVRIELMEHRPYAIWQRGGDFVIVDREGREIVPFTPGRFADLPVIVGVGAPREAAHLIDEMEVVPELRARVKAYIRVADRRWDLRLENGVTIRLPESEPVEALAEIERMDREQGLLSRDIASVDMRLDDRIVIKLTPDALARRNAALEEREKMLKRRKKDNPA